MKDNPLRSLLLKLLLFPVCAVLTPQLQAQWLVHSPTNPGISTTASFANPQPGYTGSVVAKISNVSSGVVPGVPGITPNPFTNLTPTFFSPAGFTTDPGGSFDYLNIGYNDSDDTFKVTISFASLAGGFLPAGSTIAFLDVDNGENILNLAAIGPTGGWLAPLSAPQDYFDYDNAPGGVAAGLGATFSGAGPYNLLGNSLNQDSAFQGFVTTQNIRSLSFTYSNTNANTGFMLAGDLGIAIGMRAIPEPSSAALLALGGIAGLVAFRRKLSRQVN